MARRPIVIGRRICDTAHIAIRGHGARSLTAAERREQDHEVARRSRVLATKGVGEAIAELRATA